MSLFAHHISQHYDINKTQVVIEYSKCDISASD